MKVLFFGDIVGKVGREAIKKELPGLKEKYQPDLVLANAENLAHGTGITRSTIAEMQEAGIDYFTSGNHVWKKPEAKEFLLETDCPVIAPNNLRPKLALGARLIQVKDEKILLINLLGRAFIKEEIDCFFGSLDAILKKYKDENLNGIIVDFHGEATSEKKAMGWYADGKISALVGTHTHVGTADARILLQGTAYLTDIGMVGARDSVIGLKKEEVIEHMKAEEDISLKVVIPEDGPAIINGVLIEIDPQTRRAIKIERVDLETEV